jgi:hypothetical protein
LRNRSIELEESALKCSQMETRVRGEMASKGRELEELRARY